MKRYLLLLALFFATGVHAAPTVTVSASALSILGTSQTISITVQLIDPNNTGMLKISGTGVIPIMRASTVTPGTTATVGPIYGNDVIVDGFGNSNTTYYQVQLFTVTNGFISSTPSLQNFYAFSGSGTIDLSTATPVAPSFMNGPAGVTVPGNLTVLGSLFANVSIPALTNVTLAKMNNACLFDGVVNTTLAAAVACATARGGKVWVPPSPTSYTLSATLSLGHGIDLECLGGGGLTSETNGSCTFSVTAGVPAVAILGDHVTMTNLHFISADVSSNTDDCVKVQGDFARIIGVTCEHFGRDGFRIDSTSGSNFADFFHGEDDYANSNFGQGFHWAPSGVDENAGVCIRCDAYNNSGYGFYAEDGADNVIIDPTVQNNTLGGYYLGAATTAWNFINPYCESGTGASFTMVGTWHRVEFPFFGQCTTITNSGGISNQYNYGTTGSAPQWNNLLWGPDAGATTPTIYQLQSGVQGNGYASMYDVTDAVLLWDYLPSTGQWNWLVPTKATVNSALQFVVATGNNGGTHTDSGFMQTAEANGCTTGSTAGNACGTGVTITWPVAFADTSYRVSCSSRGAPTNFPSAMYYTLTSASAITVNYIALTNAAASWPVVTCTAVHN